MRRIGHDGFGAEIVDPVEMRGGGRDVVSGEEEIDGVRGARAEGLGEGAADPCRGWGGEEGGVVAGL